MKQLVLAMAWASALGEGMAMAQEFPRAGYEGAPNGEPAPFVGEWQMKYPEGEGVIVSETIIGCDAPMTIEAVDETHISYRSPAMAEPIVAELLEFEGRTTWYPDAYETSIVVWLTPDRFHLHNTNMGRADWDNARLLIRCGSE